MHSTKILPLAKKDIREAATWYNKQKKGLGKRFTTHVRNRVRFIQGNPQASPIRYDEIRTAVVGVFPYMIHYQVDEPEQEILITAVLHTSRNPGL